LFQKKYSIKEQFLLLWNGRKFDHDDKIHHIPSCNDNEDRKYQEEEMVEERQGLDSRSLKNQEKVLLKKSYCLTRME